MAQKEVYFAGTFPPGLIASCPKKENSATPEHGEPHLLSAMGVLRAMGSNGSFGSHGCFESH